MNRSREATNGRSTSSLRFIRITLVIAIVCIALVIWAMFSMFAILDLIARTRPAIYPSNPSLNRATAASSRSRI